MIIKWLYNGKLYDKRDESWTGKSYRCKVELAQNLFDPSDLKSLHGHVEVTDSILSRGFLYPIKRNNTLLIYAAWSIDSMMEIPLELDT